ncbi:MAG: peptidoglycan-binding domain-containing protein [Chitinophagales bacterium]|nr:peptidoglycan-binding protein [Bacteroidota bacterium]
MRNLHKLTLAVVLTTFGVYAVSAQEDLPPNAQPGKCYAKCLVPDEYETVTDQILVKEASSRIEVVPATYRTVEEQILVKEAYSVLEIVPPTYTTVTEEIMVKDASSRLEYVPAVYETVTEQVMVSPASTKWVKGRSDANCLSANPDDCRVWCLKDVPAEYRTVTKQTLKSAASTREITIPAEFKTITKTVVQSPAQTVEKTVPAEYRTITKQVLDRPATTNEITIPAEYKTVTSRRLVRAGNFTEWREVVCEANMTAATISAIQRALRDRGYDPGPIDNVLGGQTREAIQKFQKDNGLAVGITGNNVPYETLKALGLY